MEASIISRSNIERSSFESKGPKVLCATEEWQRVLTWNRPLPQEVRTCIHDQIECQVKAQADKVAITSWDGDLTYRELGDAATGLASHLCQLRIEDKAIIPLCFEKSKWAIVAMLAVLKAGRSFLALDPSQPLARLRSIVEQVDAKVGLVSASQKYLLSPLPLEVVEVSEPQQYPRFDDTHGIAPVAVPDDLAYVIFTSGSTGIPKGILVEHKSFCSGAALHAPAQYLSANSRVLQFAAYTHDTSLVEILTTLMVGGTVCVPSEEQRKNGLSDFINDKGVNWAVLTPSFITSIQPEDVPTLSVVVLAGETLSQSNVRLWAASVRLLSGYGVSECSVVTTISRPMTSDTSPSNIGYPAGGICWVVDIADHNRLVLIGNVGEIIVEGPTVSRGYHKNPEATRQAFIEPPQWLLDLSPETERQSRLYKTGDLGRLNLDGTLDFISRKDLQIKIAGRRIELGEVEYHLSAHPDVRLCISNFPKKGPHANKLVAILQLHISNARTECNDEILRILPAQVAAIPCDLDEISRYMTRNVPAFMVPSIWIVVEQIPRLPSAKVDRRKVNTWLESMEDEVDITESQAFIPIDDDIALRIAAEVRKAVQSDHCMPVTRTRDIDRVISRSGIDSIKAISLVKTLNRLYNVKFKVEVLTEDDATPTLLARRIRDARREGVREYRPMPKDIQGTFEQLKNRLESRFKDAPVRVASQCSSVTSVLLTGATGYLGSEILRQLLQLEDVRVVTLVRAPSVSDARKRVIGNIRTEKWWTDRYNPRLEIWLGDLVKPQLGLEDQNWAKVTGISSSGDCIEAVIHNAANVHWTTDLRTLWPANVAATITLLEAALESPMVQRFVYVSGGASGEGSAEEQLRSLPDAYSQTKFISQALIEHLSEKAWNILDLSVVKPGFIIGTSNEGIANDNDFLWRFVASAIDLGIYDHDAREAWLTISTVDRVAKIILHRLYQWPLGPDCLSMVEDAIQQDELWKILAKDLACELQPVNHQQWVERLQARLDHVGESHPLWPLSHVLERQRFGIGSKKSMEVPSAAQSRLRLALARNMRNLAEAGFFKVHLDNGYSTILNSK